MFYNFSHGRTALKFGLKSLNLKYDQAILIPDYICEVVLHPFKALNINYIFYKTLIDLTPDWSNDS